MPLDYQEKLKIFHDEFVNYAWKYIDFQKSLAARQVVPNYITSTQNQHGLTTKIPILGSVTDLALEFDSFFSNPFKIDLYKSIRKLFPGDLNKVKKTLSIDIQKIAVHIESHLNGLENEETISQLATAAVTKLIYYLYENEIKPCTEANIVTGVLEQKSWFTRDVFVPRNLENLSQSEHYCLIKEDDLKAGSVSTDIDSSEESLNPQISSALTEYIKTQDPSIQQKQIIIYEESESILKFIAIEKPKFKTNIPELILDSDQAEIYNLQKSVSQQEKVVFNQKNSNPSDINFDNIIGGIAKFVGKKH